MIEDALWAVARSEEISGTKPINVDLGDQPIVLWRDADGIVRALEDRCPHRRAPLSLGCILKSGAIQCGYHGWTYDGATGRLVDIPNLKGKQKYPPLYRAAAFAVTEQNGFVRVCLNAKATQLSVAEEPAMPLSGTGAMVAVSRVLKASSRRVRSLSPVIASVAILSVIGKSELNGAGQCGEAHWHERSSTSLPPCSASSVIR